MPASYKKFLIIFVVICIALSIGAFFYFRWKSDRLKELERQASETVKTKNREETIKEFTTPPPDANKIELTKEQEEFTKFIPESSTPVKINTEREKLIKEFTNTQ